MPDTSDPIFSNPRLAATYDLFERDRSDLDLYHDIVDELGAKQVLDVGCGTGSFACQLANRGIGVVGLDPAKASLDIARKKEGGDLVAWHHGVAETLPPLNVDLAVMTANVAQVFVTTAEWETNLIAIAAAVRPGGYLVFETRDPSVRAWERWTPENTHAVAALPNGDQVETWCAVTSVELPLIAFRWTTVFESDGSALVSDSTLCFRTRSELNVSLDTSGFDVVEIRDAPDRPGLEWVYVARRRDE